MRPVPLDKLPPQTRHALQTMTREPLVREGAGWVPGYPCPAGERRPEPHNQAVVNWMRDVGWISIAGDEATLTQDGWSVVAALDDARAA
jgi:hypothetical protein